MNKKYLLIVTGLFVLSFLISYAAFDVQHSAANDKEASRTTDKLSGEDYFDGDTQNYKESNPYGSFFVGFDQLSDRGIPQSDQTYINDVLTNFVMYHENVFNGKISFVEDSFKKTSSPGTSAINSVYEFKFGINDDRIHLVKVDSRWLDSMITISIYDSSNKQVFSKKFRVFAD